MVYDRMVRVPSGTEVDLFYTTNNAEVVMPTN
jgi:hypothetical protein